MSKVRWTLQERGKVYGQMYRILEAEGRSMPMPAPIKVDKIVQAAFVNAQMDIGLLLNRRRKIMSFHELHYLLPSFFIAFHKELEATKVKLDIPSNMVQPEEHFNTEHGFRIDPHELPIPSAKTDVSELKAKAGNAVDDLIATYVAIAVDDVTASLEARLNNQEQVITKLIGRIDVIDTANKRVAALAGDAHNMLEELIDSSFSADQRARILALIGVTAKIAEVAAPVKIKKQKKLKADKMSVAVIGIYDSWREILEREFGDVFALELYHGREASYGNAQHTFMLTNFARHDRYWVAKDTAANFHHVSGGLSSLKRELNKLKESL